MSFSFEFNAASVEDAEKLVTEQHAPAVVKEFISQAIRGCEGKAVHVRASGHLYAGEAGSLQTSSAEIMVNPIYMQEPKK